MVQETLTQILLLLGVTIVILLGFRRLSIPGSLGFLVVGILLSTKTAGPAIQSDAIGTIAEFGIVFLLFSIGLGFSVSQIYALRHTIFKLGTAQVVMTTAIVAVLAWLLGLSAVTAFVIGAIFAQSSTTIILKQLVDQGENMTRHGRLGTTMSVFQDITAVPFVVIIPALGLAATHEIAGELVIALFKAALAFAAVLVIGRRLLRPLFQLVARDRSLELFTLTVLFVSLAAAFLTKSLGLSMAFGGFLAGMVLAETEFRHQVESAIRPFRDVLLGLFFISIGMLVDPAQLPDIWMQALGGALGLLLIKLLLVTAIVRFSGVEFQTALRTGMVLAVGGEFGFALIAIALEGGVIDGQVAQIVLNSVFFSMLIAPFLIKFNQPLARIVCRILPVPDVVYSVEEVPEPAVPGSDHVIICGYGRIGQVVSRFLEEEDIEFVALDLDPGIVRDARLAGRPVYFGDSSEPAVLESAGLIDASLMIIAHDDQTAAVRTLRNARAINPTLPMVVRTRDESQLKELRDAGATEVIPETLEAGMMIAWHALMVMDVPLERVARHLEEQRMDRYAMVRKLFRSAVGVRWPTSEEGRERLHSVVLDSGSPAVGHTLEELNIEADGVTVPILVREGSRQNNPPENQPLLPGDVLVLLGTDHGLDRVESRLTGSHPD